MCSSDFTKKQKEEKKDKWSKDASRRDTPVASKGSVSQEVALATQHEMAEMDRRRIEQSHHVSVFIKKRCVTAIDSAVALR